MTDLDNYSYRGARTLVLLHESRMRQFLIAWKRARHANLILPETADKDYVSLEALLQHILRSARGYMLWMCEKLGLPAPGIEPVPDVHVIAAAADRYLAHLLDVWRRPLAHVRPQRFFTPAYPSNWGVLYCIDSTLEHAVAHPMRHEFQLLELMRSQGIGWAPMPLQAAVRMAHIQDQMKNTVWNPTDTSDSEEPNYRYRGARALVMLLGEHLRNFLASWQTAGNVGISLPPSDAPHYSSLNALLVHVVAAVQEDLLWICKQLNLAIPASDPVPTEARIAEEAEPYLQRQLVQWNTALVDVEEERFMRPEYQSDWGVPFCIDAMLEHALLHPMRHDFQLRELLRARHT